MRAAEAPVPVLETDVAVIGSGGAGLMCALHAAAADPRLAITIVSKGAVGRSGCTRMVQGGFNAVLGEGDSLDAHFRDTLEGGHYLNDQELAWTLVCDAPRVIRELEEQFGCLFDRTAGGSLDLKPFGGQSFDRTVHRADQTGLEIMSRLRDQVLRIGARELEDWRALDLLFDQHGELSGLTLLDARTGAAAVLLARVVVVATGGSATMYRIAAPAREKTGDGMAMCWRAGLELRDMEMLQFHPTGLVAGASALTGAVLEEGLRGAGAHLRNRLGERFMERVDPVRLERSTRDVVARACYTEIVEGRGTPSGGVLLDISHLGAAEIERRFGEMAARTRLIGADLATGPVEVSPTAHFHMGGVVIDPDCLTAVHGLLVAGEDAGGTHGANRLGGNGVAESTVFGARAGQTAAAIVNARGVYMPDPGLVAASLDRAYAPLRREGSLLPFALTDRLKETMWLHGGLVRTREGLLQARQELASLAEESAQVAVAGPPEANPAWQQALDLESQLTVARLIVESALLREESRGAHFRADFPERDDEEWLRAVVVQRGGDGEPELTTRPVELTRLAPGGRVLEQA
ncbi:MAG TPA: FAD-dependent oxidoreductase [Gaiellaceae bacterium]|nr:FAD-dependent oxidoreductase [Gaiellaceae bacterium]